MIVENEIQDLKIAFLFFMMKTRSHALFHSICPPSGSQKRVRLIDLKVVFCFVFFKMVGPDNRVWVPPHYVE